MIKKFKCKKLIMQVIAFLLVFTLTFSDLLSLNVNAVEIQDGDSAIIKLHTSSTCSYIIKATYTGGGWSITEKDNQILCNGVAASMPSFWLSLVKSYCSETGSKTAKTMIVKALEFYVQETGKTVTSDVVSSTEHKTVIYKEGSEVKWGKAAKGGNYKSVLLNGNPGEKSDSMKAIGLHINNPLSCGTIAQMDQAMTGLLVDGTPITAMTDEAWLTLILNTTNVPSWIDITYMTAGTAITADATGYYAKLEVPDVDKKSGDILIKLFDKNDKNVIDFKFGEIVGEKKYREITYSNGDRKKVVVSIDGSDMLLTLKTGSAAANLSLYKTAGGSTIDSYESKIKKDNFLNAKKEIECFVAVKDAALNIVDIFGATEAKSNKAKLEKLCSVDLALLDEIFGEKSFNLIQGDWIFELASGKDDVVIAYKENDPDPDQNGWYYYLDELKPIRVDTDGYYDLFVPTKETKSGTKCTSKPYKKAMPFSVLRGNPPDGDTNSLMTSREALFNEILSGSTVYCSTRTLKYDSQVGTSTKPLLLGDTYTDGSEPSGKDYPPDFPINDFLLLTDDLQDKIDGNSQILNDVYAQLGDSKIDFKHNFVDDVLKYGKLIILFLLLLAVTYTAILSIQSSTDIKKRVLIKERLKDILIGVIIFACIIPIYNLVIHFLNDSYTSLGEFTGDFSGPTYYATITRFKVGYIVKFIGSILDIFTVAINKLIDSVLAVSIGPGKVVTLMELIFTATEPNGLASSLMPFTEGEWAQYMMGYRLITIVFMGFVAIALVKVAISYMLGAGNINKIEGAKEDLKRIIVATLIVVLAPYGFRLILLLFNYLTSMLPIDGSTAKFDIDFESAGFVGSVANLLFATVRFRIYVVFFVRKVLLALMLITTPFVCGTWVVSNKFRGFNLWYGTILSSAAQQFCYALVFMVVILITYKGQNPFITLIVVVLIPKFANFFSESLKGLGQVWGGMNAEQIAGQVVDGYKNVGKKALGKFKNTGRFLQRAAGKADPNGITKAGRNVHNVGAIMSGNFLGVQTKRDAAMVNMQNAEAQFDKDRNALKQAKTSRDNILSTRADNDPLYAYDNALRDGKIEEAQKLRGDDAAYDVIDNYYDAKQRADLSEYKLQGWQNIVNSRDIKDTGIIGGIEARLDPSNKLNSQIDKEYAKIFGKVDNYRQNRKNVKGTDENLASLIERTDNLIKGRRTNDKTAKNDTVDKVFRDLISYMENAENKTSVSVEVSDAIFAGLFEAKTKKSGFSPEMAVKYQETKEQFFVLDESSNVRISEKTTTQSAEEISASGTAHDSMQTSKGVTTEQVHPADDKRVGESMVSVQNETADQTSTQQASTTEKKEESKSILTPSDQKEKAGNEADVGESMFGAGEKITPGAGGSITTEAGGKAIDDSFSAELSSNTGFDIQTESYASEHGGETVGDTNAGSNAKSNNVEAKASTPQKRENMNWGSIGELSEDRKRELIKHHDTKHEYLEKEDIFIPTENDISSNMNVINEKELVDESRLKEIAKIVDEYSADNPYDDADEVVKKALEEFVERELKKERKVTHEPTLRHPDFNAKK